MPFPNARPSASNAASNAGAWPPTWPPSRRQAAARLTRGLDDAAASHGHAMVLVGEPGIGRTTMLNRVAAHASGRFLIARARGYAHGSEAPGVTLAELLRQLGPVAEAAVDADATGRALLARLDTVRRPVLITVDDAQWLDAGSLDSLGRLARRLSGRRALLLIAVRSGAGGVCARPSALCGLPDMVLDRLTDGESADLIGRSPGRLDGATCRLAAGNPLALELFGAGLLPFVAPRDAELRLRLTEVFARELDSLSASARETLAEIALQLGDVNRPGPGSPVCNSPAGAELEAAGLLLHNAGRWRLAHPLLAPAALVNTAPARLRELHALAAAALSGDSAPAAAIRRLQHLVAAANGHDERLAAEIEALVRDGEPEMATVGRLLISAASLSSGPDGRLRRLRAGIDALQCAGLFAEADAQAVYAEGLAGTFADRVALTDLRLANEAVTGRPACARDALLRLAAATSDTDPGGAAERYRRAAMLSVELGEIELAQAALSRPGGPLTDEPGADRDDLIGLAGALARTVPASVENGDAAGWAMVPVAWARALAGDLPGALGPLESAAEVARRRSAHGMLPALLIALSGLRLASGRVAGALAAADEALRVARATGAMAIAPRALLALARTEAVIGREQDCRGHVEEAMAWCRAEQDTSLLVQASGILGFLALSLGDHAEALSHLEANPPVSLVEDAVMPWAGDLVEALVRLGTRTQAGQVLAETEATGRTPAALRCALGRGRGLLADDPERAVQHLVEAIRAARAGGLVIEEARSLTVLGEVLAGRDLAAARRSILAGAALFDRLGALRWRAWARQLLGDVGRGRADGASGLPAPQHAASPPEAPGGADLTLLTTQELSVARLAADGLTNQQVAGALFLSVRTVEFHLSNAYRKLQVKRRAQLVRMIAAGQDGEGRAADRQSR